MASENKSKGGIHFTMHPNRDGGFTMIADLRPYGGCGTRRGTAAGFLRYTSSGRGKQTPLPLIMPVILAVQSCGLPRVSQAYVGIPAAPDALDDDPPAS